MKAGTFSIAADAGQHLDHLLVGPAVAGAVEGGAGGGAGRVGVGVRGPDHPHGRGRAVLLVVGVEDEQDVERLGQHRVGLEAGLGHLPHHREEVGREVELVVGVDEGHPHAEPVGRRGQGGHLGDEPDDLLVARDRVEDLLGVEIEGRQGGHRRDQHPHGVGVVVEPLEEPLAHVLVDEGVHGDLALPDLELVTGRQLAVEEQVGDLEVGGLLGQLLDRVAAVAQDAGVAVQVGDGALAGRRRHEAGVVEPHAREDLRPLRGGHTPVHDGDLERLPGAVVGDRDALRHDRDDLLLVLVWATGLIL